MQGTLHSSSYLDSLLLWHLDHVHFSGFISSSFPSIFLATSQFPFQALSWLILTCLCSTASLLLSLYSLWVISSSSVFSSTLYGPILKSFFSNSHLCNWLPFEQYCLNVSSNFLSSTYPNSGHYLPTKSISMLSFLSTKPLPSTQWLSVYLWFFFSLFPHAVSNLLNISWLHFLFFISATGILSPWLLQLPFGYLFCGPLIPYHTSDRATFWR